jgi:mannose-6-phosphate isomerase-like protein (cupin superfamily)
MIIKDLNECRWFEALDKTSICELMHPDKEKIDIPYSIAYAILGPGRSSLAHCLKNSSELYFIIQGTAKIYIDEDEEFIRSGQAVFIPPGSWQHLKNTGSEDLRFLCIVFPRWRAEDEELKSNVREKLN